jgi:hypothetical protein
MTPRAMEFVMDAMNPPMVLEAGGGTRAASLDGVARLDAHSRFLLEVYGEFEITIGPS